MPIIINDTSVDDITQQGLVLPIMQWTVTNRKTIDKILGKKCYNVEAINEYSVGIDRE